ncbi:MAG: DUF4177 domain-containing protein [Chryseobacterium sp.]|uniref:DUF4177 domain-containing protein n=1 Tax=Chryseobacterium sp. TaxID=1871047 RepID=UPI001B163504|nr:DUF4177 domain-containing protein [Chryseobacterium sp.]MBO6183981.1 DUF4177 domain-containing protein [Chryseobacterium sp.]
MKKRFEYKTVVVKPKVSFWTVEYDPNEMDKTLNKYGNEGWELLSVESREYMGTYIFHYTFKREQ